jgi:MshEN domain
MKLGEALIKDALITKQQLEQALRRQVQFGGRIGTNIVELRFMEEDELLKFMSRHFKLPAIPLEELNSVPEEVINSVSVELVNKYKILPFKKDRNRLHAALLNPKDIKEINDLCFVTGFDIIPYVITELRMVYALEKYYGIKRDIRYISLRDRLDPETKIEESSVDKIKVSFAAVEGTEEIAGILINEVYKIAKRVALFTVKGEKVVGWKARGLAVEGVELPAKDSPVFSEVLRSRTNYRGPVMNIKGNEPLIKVLTGTPQDALVLPINIREKTIALLYIDNGNRDVLNANVGFLSMLASMAAIAFEMLVLKKRILDLTFPL